MRISSRLSSIIANIGFICTCLVVAIHTPKVRGGLSGWFATYIQNNVTGLSAVAVPMFFVISGFFLASRYEGGGWYRTAIRKRIKSVMIPFFVLNAFWFPVKYGFHWVGVKWFGADGSAAVMDFSLENFIGGMGLLPNQGCVLDPLWYLKALFCLVLVSPVFFWFYKRGKIALVVLIGVLALLRHVQVGASHPSWIGDRWIFEWSWGCPLFFVVGMLWHSLLKVRLPRCVEPVLNLLGRRMPSVLTRNAFAVFALHFMVLCLLPIPFKAFHLWNEMLEIAGAIPLFLMTIVISILVAEILKHYMPRVADVIFGGRV